MFHKCYYFFYKILLTPSFLNSTANYNNSIIQQVCTAFLRLLQGQNRVIWLNCLFLWSVFSFRSTTACPVSTPNHRCLLFLLQCSLTGALACVQAILLGCYDSERASLFADHIISCGITSRSSCNQQNAITTQAGPPLQLF